MKTIKFFALLISISIQSQNIIETALIKNSELTADVFISKNNFNTTYYIFNNVLLKNSTDIKGIDIGYSNFQLGPIASANTFNPLKINLFYKDFNTVVILDNRLAEIFKIDFNKLPNFKNITHVSTGADNTIWIFNQDSQQIELYDYKTNTTRSKTIPIENPVLKIDSNYNFCWVLTKKYIYIYDYFGNLIKKLKNNDFTDFTLNRDDAVFKKNHNLFYLKKNTESFLPIKIPNLLISQFFATNETLYIYHDNILQQFELKNL